MRLQLSPAQQSYVCVLRETFYLQLPIIRLPFPSNIDYLYSNHFHLLPMNAKWKMAKVFASPVVDGMRAPNPILLNVLQREHSVPTEKK